MATPKKENKIGKKIKDTLNAFGITVKELSRKTGIEAQTLYSIINGHHQASVEKLEKICKTLHLSMDALLDMEVNTFPIFPQQYEESLSYAHFEDVWFGPSGGERISVSRNFSIMNQSVELRRQFLKNIYEIPEDRLEQAISAFKKRQEVIKRKEKRRLEIVVESEVVDFIHQREPFDRLDKSLIVDCIENIIDRLKNEPLNFEVILIPRQFFLVNYEIINREVILFDLGSVFFRQTHPSLLEHFLNEVQDFKFKRASIAQRDHVLQFLEEHLNAARK